MNVVLPDALFQYHLYAFLPDALPELHELGRGARGTRLYRLLLPEVLVVDILLSAPRRSRQTRCTGVSVSAARPAVVGAV